MKADPRLVAAARELKDRWLEQLNSDPDALRNATTAKYDVTRAMRPSHVDSQVFGDEISTRRALPSAA